MADLDNDPQQRKPEQAAPTQPAIAAPRFRELPAASRINIQSQSTVEVVANTDGSFAEIEFIPTEKFANRNPRIVIKRDAIVGQGLEEIDRGIQQHLTRIEGSRDNSNTRRLHAARMPGHCKAPPTQRRR